MSDGSYTGQRTFGALDIRKKGIKTEMYTVPALAAFGGPLPVSDSFPKDEEETILTFIEFATCAKIAEDHFYFDLYFRKNTESKRFYSKCRRK
ncbi:hypothetical protein Anas_01523 [Armadillidium nasatum]|uniref:Uncharacterized protein n=1 Tax=Armadillidium nasatum TaxID=96803 RepID=A0A5N5TNV3_9CRUS|nr:hypothetical protein Anas_01523 [Armadillidium nasatum]